MDRLRRDDIERARRMSAAERLECALALMASGIELQRDALRARYPAESAEAIEARLDAWLTRQ